MDVFERVRAAALRHGVDPELAVRVARQESGGNVRAISNKGAIGPMQLMAGTARDLGVDPHDPEQNIDGGVRYLKRQLDDFGDPKLALAAYNAGPGAVRKYGGVPPYAETQDYVRKIGGQSMRAPQEFDGSDIFGMGSQPAVAAPQAGPDFDGSDIFAAPAKAVAPPPANKPPPQVAPAPPPQTQREPTIAQDVASGFAQPFKTLGHDLMAEYRRKSGPQKMPASVGEFFKQTGDDMMFAPRMLGDVLGLGGAPVQAVVRPTARAVGKALPNPNQQQTMRFEGGRPVFPKTRKLTDDEEQGMLEGVMNNALSAARPANSAPRVPGQKPKDLPELHAEQKAAWDKVDASGYRFAKPEVQKAATDIRQIVDDAGPELYGKSALIADRVEKLAARGDLTPAQANRLRSQIGEKLLAPGSDEVSVGKAIKDRIDQLIDADPSPVLKDAREAYKRYVKYKDVSDRIDDSKLAQNAAGTGGNPNSVRQALKPLVKKKGGQRILNATPDETKALRAVVNGTPAQNLARAASAFDPFHSRLGMLLQGGLGLKTGGLSAVTIPVGMAATAAERQMSKSSVQKLLDLISTGGVKPGVQPYAPTPASMLPRGAGLAGVGVSTAPLVRIPSPKEPARKKKAAGR